MSQQRHEWRGYWDEYGTRVDDGKIVSIRVGVIQIDGHLSVAISVAATPPVTITSRIAAGLGELMQWAQDEHKMLAEQATVLGRAACVLGATVVTVGGDASRVERRSGCG